VEPLFVYYSSTSLNTHRFVSKLDMPAKRIPISMKEEPPLIEQPYILICPTYADDDGSKAVPKQVIKFLNDPANRSLMVGVISSGNRNFGELFAYAGDVIARKCNVPVLYRFELSGTPSDVSKIRAGVNKLWRPLTQKIQKTQQPLHVKVSA